MTLDQWPHGSRHVYSVYKCRCPECTRANRDYMRAYQQREPRRAYEREYKQRRRADLRARLLTVTIST